MGIEWRGLPGAAAERFERACTHPGLRQAVKLLLDGGLAALGWVIAYSLAHLALPTADATLAWTAFALALNIPFQHTRQLYRLMGPVEIRALLVSTGMMILLAGAGNLLNERLHFDIEPPSVTLVACLLTGLHWMMLRAMVVVYFQRKALLKLQRTASNTPGGSDPMLRTLIVGAGQAGAQLCQELRTNPKLNAQVVGFVDDALEKQGARIQGLPVLGHSTLLPVFIQETQATQVILAMPSAPGSRIRELAQVLYPLGVRVKTLPSMLSFLGDKAWKPELRDIAIEDLLRREPITLDLGSIRQELEHSVVLITGGGGSIGGELARQVAAFNPARLVLLGRGENSLWQVETELRRSFPKLVIDVELCDIRNQPHLRRAFETWRPQIVFHAAAHKHVPYLERYPEEGIQNNIFGTQNVLEVARAVGTKRFVNISTDKAVNPTSVLGVTKRIAEFLVLQAADEETATSRFVSVRFGNVLGSRGSVIPLFHEQIRNGGPLTVTHPDMTRYFMTIPEASQLVLQAGMLGRTGKVFVLDMGQPVRIVDLATDMARLSGLTPGYDIRIEFSGIRPGEKLFEELFTDQEQRRSDVHAKVFEATGVHRDRQVLARGLQSLREALALPDGERHAALARLFRDLVPDYQPSPVGLGRYFEARPEAPPRPPSGPHPLTVPSLLPVQEA